MQPPKCAPVQHRLNTKAQRTPPRDRRQPSRKDQAPCNLNAFPAETPRLQEPDRLAHICDVAEDAENPSEQPEARGMRRITAPPL
mmetsp:Transcript_116422/g.249006  ORF Transcript_116422/g.249006 Transcript_116422/m.249006 type:complete len:85 (+) Transcript_116422:144-398(+)